WCEEYRRGVFQACAAQTLALLDTPREGRHREPVVRLSSPDGPVASGLLEDLREWLLGVEPPPHPGGVNAPARFPTPTPKRVLAAVPVTAVRLLRGQGRRAHAQPVWLEVELVAPGRGEIYPALDQVMVCRDLEFRQSEQEGRSLAVNELGCQ